MYTWVTSACVLCSIGLGCFLLKVTIASTFLHQWHCTCKPWQNWRLVLIWKKQIPDNSAQGCPLASIQSSTDYLHPGFRQQSSLIHVILVLWYEKDPRQKLCSISAESHRAWDGLSRSPSLEMRIQYSSQSFRRKYCNNFFRCSIIPSRPLRECRSWTRGGRHMKSENIRALMHISFWSDCVRIEHHMRVA